MAQEYTIQPSPILREHKSVFETGVQGAWTPDATFTTPGDLSISYSFQLGTYTKFGSLVITSFDLLATAGNFTHSSASGDFRITGLPFVSRQEANPNQRAVGSLRFEGVNSSSYTQFTPAIPGGASYIEIWQSGSGQALSGLGVTHLPTGSVLWFSGSIMYLTE